MSNARGYSFEDSQFFKEMPIKEQRRFRKSVIDMRLEFAKLLRNDESAFDICVKEYQNIGAKGFQTKSKAGRPEIPNSVLAMLLAKYEDRNRIQRTTKEQFFEREIKSNYWTDFHHYKFNSSSAVESALKKAQRLAKESPEFKELSEIYLHVYLRESNYPPS